MERKLYMNPNGQDMWLILDVDHKRVKAIDILTRNETTYPFLTKKDAKDNYNFWLENSELRLPRTFIIKASEFVPRNELTDVLVELALPVPIRKDMKEYVVYHKSKDKYIHMNIENFTNSILPELDAKQLRKISLKASLTREETSYQKGLFSYECK